MQAKLSVTHKSRITAKDLFEGNSFENENDKLLGHLGTEFNDISPCSAVKYRKLFC